LEKSPKRKGELKCLNKNKRIIINKKENGKTKKKSDYHNSSLGRHRRINRGPS